MRPSRTALALLLPLLLLVPACGGPEGGGQAAVLRFSGIPDQDTSRLQQRFAPLAAYLTERLGVPVEYVPTKDYQASVEMFVNGQILFAWFGGLTGVQARHRVPGARAIVQGRDDVAFVSYFVAHASTGLERHDEFPHAAKGMTFTFGSESSTSGRLMPEHFIRASTGQTPDAFFRTVAFQKNHDKTAEIVESGAVQVGALNAKVYDRRVREGQTDPGVCKVIWQTPSYADYNFTAHPRLEERYGSGFTEKLRQALLEMNDPALLAALERPSGLIPAEDREYEQIRRVARGLGFLD